jgi:hypothetical protein
MQARIFETYMRGVWENVLKGQDGQDIYEEQHDACEVAQAFGAKPTGSDSNGASDGTWTEWLFQDGSLTWILVRYGEGVGTTNVLP